MTVPTRLVVVLKSTGEAHPQEHTARGVPLSEVVAGLTSAAVSAGLIWIEMQARSRRHHSGLADAMVYQAIEQFLPVGAAGALLAVMLGKFAPETLWILPGLWQVLVSLGVFASVRTLPRTANFLNSATKDMEPSILLKEA